jgi:hypothetical protein
MSEQKIFEVPWGSESICYWCKKQGQCSLYKDDPEIPTMTLPASANPPSLEVLQRAGVKIRFTQLLKLGSLRGCPLNEFEPDETKLPESFKRCRIVVRETK